MRGFAQENPYHSETLGDHMLMAEAYAGHHGFPYEVIEAALYHDIGKVRTKTFRDKKGNPSEIAHYYSHEFVGTYMYLVKALYDGLFKDDVILHVAFLIANHMRPLNAWKTSEDARQKDKTVFGEKLFHELEMLSEADENGKEVNNPTP